MTVITFFAIIFAILAVVGASMLLPLMAALFCREYSMVAPFVVPMVASFVVGAVFLLARRKQQQFSLSTRAVFLLVTVVWIAICVFGTVPLVASGCFPSFTDALFEAVSGFSTTGATVLSDVESIPRSINLWRCEMHWLGGMGVIALTVALLPLLGVGGFALIKAESTGVEKGKITPKIANTAETLWVLYVGFTAVQTLLLLICGMDALDALSYAFSTMGTGGYATRNESIAAYNSRAIEAVCTLFMFLGGINFTMYFYLIVRRFSEVRKNSELKAYIGIFTAATVGITLLLARYYGSLGKALRYAIFQVASIITTTGFSTADYTQWPQSAQIILFGLFFIGGCAGSTAGGFKVVRWVILAKQAKNEILRMLHPHGLFTVRLNGQPGRKDLVFNVAAFIYVYLIVIALTAFVGTVAGLRVYSAITVAFSMVQNVGPAFDELGPEINYGFLPAWLKWWYCFVMLAGRLELYNLIIFFVPDYWKK